MVEQILQKTTSLQKLGDFISKDSNRKFKNIYKMEDSIFILLTLVMILEYNEFTTLCSDGVTFHQHTCN